MEPFGRQHWYWKLVVAASVGLLGGGAQMKVVGCGSAKKTAVVVPGSRRAAVQALGLLPAAGRAGEALGATASGKAPTPLRTSYGKLPEQVGDLWLPRGTPRGAVALLHGGFWLAQYGKQLMDAVALDLAERGYAAWNLEYRRVGSKSWTGPSSTFEDVSAGLDFLSSNKLSLTPGLPTAVVGHSAGGHLALWSQLRTRAPERPCSAAVSVGGVLDLVYADEQGLGGGAGAVQRFLKYKDPVSVRQDTSPIDMLPPCLVNSLPPEVAARGVTPRARLGLVHGQLDDVVPPEHSIRFTVSSTCAGVPCELRLVRNEGHYEVLNPKSKSWNAVLDFVTSAFAAGDVERPLRGPMAPTLREETSEEVIVRSRLKQAA